MSPLQRPVDRLGQADRAGIAVPDHLHLVHDVGETKVGLRVGEVERVGQGPRVRTRRPEPCLSAPYRDRSQVRSGWGCPRPGRDRKPCWSPIIRAVVGGVLRAWPVAQLCPKPSIDLPYRIGTGLVQAGRGTHSNPVIFPISRLG